jgi:IclR family acetate operon transcriptional repressor
MRLPELADVVELGKPSTLRLLQTLVATGFAARVDGGSYVLNRRWISSGTDAFLQALVEAATPEMVQLNADLAETVSLAALVEDHIRVIHVIESPRHIRMSNYRDRILPPYASSLGKAIAAYQPPERLNLLLRVYGIYPFTKNTITEPIKIREELEKVREQGFAREYEETVEGGCCIGVPIRPGGEPVRGAISMSLPTARLTVDLETVLPESLKNAASRISNRLAAMPRTAAPGGAELLPAEVTRAVRVPVE